MPKQSIVEVLLHPKYPQCRGSMIKRDIYVNKIILKTCALGEYYVRTNEESMTFSKTFKATIIHWNDRVGLTKQQIAAKLIELGY